MSTAGVVLGVGLLGVAGALIFAKRKAITAAIAPVPEPNVPTNGRAPMAMPVWTPQGPQDLRDLLQSACSCVAATSRLSDEQLAVCVWGVHWPSIPFPSRGIVGDHPSVQEALDAVRAAIQAAHAGECEGLPDVDDEDTAPLPPPLPPPIPPPPKLGESLAAEHAAPLIPVAMAASKPPIATFKLSKALDVAALTRQTPTPGFFYQVAPGERFFGDTGIVARALTRAVLDAAKAKGWSNANASAAATALAADVKARVAYSKVIQCGPWNDAMYGTWGYSPEDFPAPHGRAIPLIARHDRVADRLAAGQAPIRTLDRGTPMSKGTGTATGAGDMLELLWLPPLRSDALLDPSRTNQIVAEGLVWPDGSSKINPPPEVESLGIANAPAGPWGCEELAA